MMLPNLIGRHAPQGPGLGGVYANIRHRRASLELKRRLSRLDFTRRPSLPASRTVRFAGFSCVPRSWTSPRNPPRGAPQ